jgi:hypothetical protein
MLREEASKEKLGFGRNWDTSVGAESGKRGKREEEEVVGGHGSHPPPAEKPEAGVVVGGEYSGEGSMTACENREVLSQKKREPRSVGHKGLGRRKARGGFGKYGPNRTEHLRVAA